MSVQITGAMEYKEMGPGTWALVADSGETYELKDVPDELQHSELKVTVEGEVRDDIMTFAMVGPVLEVKSFKVL